MTSLAIACSMGAGAPPSIPGRVRSILRKYGATLLMPGPSGIMQYGFQPGNYRESTGQTLAAADQQVGLVVDAARVPGPELIQVLNFASSSQWDMTNTASFTANTWSMGSSGGPMLVTVPGKTYSVSFPWSATAYGTFALYNGTGIGAPVVAQQSGTSGTLTLIFTAAANRAYFRFSAGGTVAAGAISVRELPGILASQSTSGFQPYLRKVPKTLGPELVVNGDFSNGTTGWVGGFATLSVSGGVLNVTATGTASVRAGTVLSTQAGRWYRVTLDIVSGVVTNAVARDGVFPGAMGTFLTTATVSGSRLTFVFLAISSVTSIYTDRVSGAAINDVYQIDNVSVCEVLEWTYAWQFDGTDDRLSLSTVPFQTQDVSFAVCAYNPTVSDATFRRLFEFGGNGTEIQLSAVNGGVNYSVKGDTGSQTSLTAGGTSPAGSSRVVSVVNTSLSSRYLRVDGVQQGPVNTFAVSDSTANVATLGNRAAGDRAFSGHKHLQIFGKGTTPPTEAELRTLERWAASLQGRTL